jgi:hypothetical protein
VWYPAVALGGAPHMEQPDEARWFEAHSASDLFAVDPHQMLAPAPEKGDGVAAAARVSGRTKRMISEIVQSGKFLFRTESDLIRTAVEFFLQRHVLPALDQDSPMAQALLAQNRAMNQASMGGQFEELERYVENVRKTVRRLLKLGLEDRAIDYLASMIREYRKSPDSDWKVMVDAALRQIPMLEKIWGEADEAATFVKGHKAAESAPAQAAEAEDADEYLRLLAAGIDLG